jgi:hypothetical protein
MKSLIYFLSLLMIALNALDLISTMIGLSVGLNEMNPLIYSLGLTGFFMLKISLTTITAISCTYLSQFKSLRYSLVSLLSIMSAIFTVCSINNLILIF